ncbi:hypothetical protein PV325_008052 [Microctonus aethiopoides]|uniref:chymotrypsin n=1 Tax=Microctonus aethiopoides TaxID=144406 RepID=A0AA39CAM8_9HYME|nr:hypothetical protein PV326_004968 [Microctonus aethiopoides]KAK0089297.1 hypothetical protein PV325_008052 [Microctonus aethiopoides]KAK0160913.1 hypothetical protein PV328_008270 [Microctonus aethiopoides]
MYLPTDVALLLAIVIAGCSAREIPRVVGGDDAAEGAHPYQVSLRSPSNSHFCGGVILSKRWILTAAHCIVYKNPSKVVVVAGTNRLSHGGVHYKVELVVSNEDYDSGRFANDIGLVRVTKDIEFTEKIHSIPVSTSDLFKEEYPAVLSGWGSTSLGGSLPDKLQELELKVISQNKCKGFHAMVTEGHVCTLTVDGEGACHGDSGGPLTSDGLLIGLVSFGRPCAKGYPDVYTRVSSYLEWIHTTIQTNEKQFN